MNHIALAFGKRIRDIRISKNISQEKLAELSGLHPTYIGQIERGEKSPTLDSINKISEGLHTSLSQLFDHMGSAAEPEDRNYAAMIYNEILNLPDSKKEKLYRIICDIINL